MAIEMFKIGFDKYFRFLFVSIFFLRLTAPKALNDKITNRFFMAVKVYVEGT
jgi:hypothetical protein